MNYLVPTQVITLDIDQPNDRPAWRHISITAHSAKIITETMNEAVLTSFKGYVKSACVSAAYDAADLCWRSGLLSVSSQEVYN